MTTDDPSEDASAPSGDHDTVPVHQRAILSVGLGVAAFLLLVVEPFGSLILSLPAITTGVHARREIQGSGGAQRGSDLAGFGLAIGGSTLVLAVVAVFLDLL